MLLIETGQIEFIPDLDILNKWPSAACCGCYVGNAVNHRSVACEQLSNRDLVILDVFHG